MTITKKDCGQIEDERGLDLDPDLFITMIMTKIMRMIDTNGEEFAEEMKKGDPMMEEIDEKTVIGLNPSMMRMSTTDLKMKITD